MACKSCITREVWRNLPSRARRGSPPPARTELRPATTTWGTSWRDKSGLISTIVLRQGNATLLIVEEVLCFAYAQNVADRSTVPLRNENVFQLQRIAVSFYLQYLTRINLPY